MRKTKIICTIGPASDSEEMLEALCKNGMNVARLNFSHGSHEGYKSIMERIRRVREKLSLPVAVMLDTKGPEYRIKTFKEGKVTVKDGDPFIFTTEDTVGDETRVSVNYDHLTDDLSVGDLILVNNGLVSFRVDRIEGKDVHTTVLIGGVLSDRKSMNFPGRVLRHEYLSEQDKADLLFGIREEIDFVAASFVSSRADAQALRDFLDENGGREIGLIAKIENRAGTCTTARRSRSLSRLASRLARVEPKLSPRMYKGASVRPLASSHRRMNCSAASASPWSPKTSGAYFSSNRRLYPAPGGL